MRYRTFVSMKIALIGTGEIAESYAMRYVNAGHEVLMAWKQDSAAGISPRLAQIENVHICGIEDAAALADLVIIATPPSHVREVAYWLGDVRRNVIIDASCNLHNAGEHVNTFSAIKAITGSPHVVKVFSTRNYEKLLKPLFCHDQAQLIMAGDSRKAKELIKILTLDVGINTFLDLGGSEAIPLLDEMTSGWLKLAQATDKTAAAANRIRI